MKRLTIPAARSNEIMRRAVSLLILAALSVSIGAQQVTCDKCTYIPPLSDGSGNVTQCEQALPGYTGRAGCTAGHTDSGCGFDTDPSSNPGNGSVHCHFSGGACQTYTPPPPSGDLEDGQNGNSCQYCSPIVINLGNGGYRFSDASDPVLFDLDGDGNAERITWAARDSRLAILTIDRNGNGAVDSGRELFGTAAAVGVIGPSVASWNGFDLLRLYDANANGLIDEYDAIWPRLRLWVDANHDGASQPSELRTLESAGIEWFGLDYHPTNRHDPNGNALRFKSTLRRNGHAEPYYDVYFALVN